MRFEWGMGICCAMGLDFQSCKIKTSRDLLYAAAAAAKSLYSCPTLCDPIDGSPPGSSVPGILQATTLEWVAISFSNAWKCKVNMKSLSCVQLLETPWTATYQAPPPMGFSRQEYWSGLPLLSLIKSLDIIKGKIYLAWSIESGIDIAQPNSLWPHGL